MEKRHILICGPRGAGKTTLIESLLKHCTVPVYGFFTRSTPCSEDGFHSIYIHPASEAEPVRTEENHIGDCNGRQRTVHPEVFTKVGVPLLSARADGIIVMDELGFMETGSKPFCDGVLACLDGEIPVIAGVKEYDAPFLNQILSHPSAAVYRITQENRDALYRELLPVIERWNAR